MVATSIDALTSVAGLVIWFSLNATRATPRGQGSPGCRMRIDLAPRHPARLTTESTAGLLARGSPPVTAFPGNPSGSVVRARRLQLRGQLRNRNVGDQVPCSLTAFPVSSHVRDRRSRSLNGPGGRLVNAHDFRADPAVGGHAHAADRCRHSEMTFRLHRDVEYPDNTNASFYFSIEDDVAG